MANFNTEQMVYLLYAKAYTDQTGTVTKGDVKSHLPDEWKEKAEKIYTDLKTHKMIEPKTKDGKPANKDGRFSITEKGLTVLISNLAITDYEFTTSKGYKRKVLNALLTCIQKAVEAYSQDKPSKEMTFDEFEQKFKTLYLEERKRQEIKGVVAIHSKELCQKFAEQYSISYKKLNHYFELLKSNGKILTVIERGNELMQWGG